MALPPDQVMPLVKEGFTTLGKEEKRHFLRLNDLVYGQVKAPKLQPSHHRIKHSPVLVVEVGSKKHYYVYLDVPTWLVNGVEIGKYNSCVYLESDRPRAKANHGGRADLANQADAMKHIKRMIHNKFYEWKLGTSDLNQALDKLYQKRSEGKALGKLSEDGDPSTPLESQLIPPPVQLSISKENWRQIVNYTQLKAGQIDCTVEIVFRTSKPLENARAKLDNQCPFDMHSTFKDVLSWALKIPVFRIQDTVDIKSILAKDGYSIELWVLPQKHKHGEMYEWKETSGRELLVFLDKDMWKDHKQLYIEAHITGGPKEVADGGMEDDE